MKGILGKKIGMTQVFSKDGKLVPVTVIEIVPNVVTQVKTKDSDGYSSIQLGYEDIREKLSNKAKIGHTKKANTAPKRFLKEIKEPVGTYNIGDQVTCDIFEAGEFVDVSGVSKGKGYQGVIKKNNQHRGPMTHGSKYHRGVGSLGTMLPKRVLKGKALPSHMGANNTTIQNLEIIKVDLEENCILVKGSIPGSKKSFVMIKEAVKLSDKNKAFDFITYDDEKIEAAIEETKEEVVAENPTVEEAPSTEKTEEPIANDETVESTSKEEETK